MLLFIYCLPLEIIVLAMVLAVLGYAGVQADLSPYPKAHRWWQRGNALLLIPAVAVVIYATILTRSGEAREVVLFPFNFIIEGQKNREAYRTFLMNVFLFLPFGLTLSTALGKKWRPALRMGAVAGAGLLLSVLIESLQYCFQLGRVETDDVIANTLGALIGATCLLWAQLLRKDHTD